MTVPISNVTRRVVFAPSGTGPYAFTFEILANTDIQVYKGDTLLTLTTDYTVTINSNGTGSVTLVATAGTDNITIVGARAIQRTTDFVTGGDLFANSLNTELDSLTIFTQQNAESNARSIKAPVTDPTTINMTLPTKANRANKVLSFNSSTGNPETTITVTAINNAASDAAAAAASASAAAASASSASSSATSATNSASSATSSASSATSSASAASASASAASASESNAASSASAASTSASNASTSASNASTSASNASTSASNAANSATAAQNAQTAAESARDSTLAAFDSFDDRYLGTKTSDPTLDNDGNALVAGALYFNSVDGAMKVYTGSAWVAAYVSGTGFVDLASAQTITGIKTFDNGLKTDTISEETSAAGVTVDGVLLKDNQVSTDQINEKTSSAGVTIDSVLLKDGLVGIGADGTASAPSIYRASDTNTGIFFPAADTIAFAEGGAEAMRIDSSGNVGIGTSSPGAKFGVGGGAGNAKIKLSNTASGSGGTDGFDLDFDGSNIYITNRENGFMAFENNGAERARITSGGDFQFNSGYGSVATAYGCRAWVNFDGTGTPAIREDGNVSSITDNGTGDYTVNFTTAMPDANYGVTGSAGLAASPGGRLFEVKNQTAPTTSAVRVFCVNVAGTPTDYDFVSASIFR